MKVRELSAIGKLLGMCGLGKMKSADKVCVVKASRAIKKAVAEYDEAAQEAVRCLKPEGFDALRDKSRSTGLSGEEAAEFGRMMAMWRRLQLISARRRQCRNLKDWARMHSFRLLTATSR